MRSTKLLSTALAAVGVLLVGALVAAVYFGYGWGHALIVEKPNAVAREDALSGARQAAVNLSTYDSADLDKSFTNIESSITGDSMKNDLNATKAQIGERLKQSKAKTEATVIDAALTEFNRDDGTGNAFVVLASNTTWPDQPPRKVKFSVRMTIEKVDGIWKASKMETVGSPIAMDSGVPTVPNEPAPAPAPAPPAPGQGSGG